jgi:uncharacterized protein (DUF2126 family)
LTGAHIGLGLVDLVVFAKIFGWLSRCIRANEERAVAEKLNQEERNGRFTMRIPRTKDLTPFLLLLLTSGAAASAQIVRNGSFTPPANSSSNTTTYQGSNGGVNLPLQKRR